MNVTINGVPRAVPEHSVLADLVPAGATGIAVALNGEVVHAASRAATRLHSGDRIELVTATQGG